MTWQTLGQLRDRGLTAGVLISNRHGFQYTYLRYDVLPCGCGAHIGRDEDGEKVLHDRAYWMMEDAA